MHYNSQNNNSCEGINILMEIAIREKGKVRWVKLDTVISKLVNKKANTLPISSNEDFDKWYDLYDYKKGLSKTKKSWNSQVTKKLIPIIIKHTIEYIKSTPNKKYRKHPSTYLNQHTWEDEIVVEEKEYELKEYPRDKTDFPRAWCSKCEKVDTYYDWEIKKGSKCCNSTDKEKVVLLPYDPKINKRKYGR